MRKRRLPHPLNMPKQEPTALGHLLEGVVEQDPLTDLYVVRTIDSKGQPTTVDVQALLAQYVGKEVRMTLASFENLERLAKLVEKQGGGQVFGVQPDELPVPFQIARKG